MAYVVQLPLQEETPPDNGDWRVAFTNDERHPPHTFLITFGSTGMDHDEAMAYSDSILRLLNK